MQSLQNLKKMIIDHKKVHFRFYRDGELWYSTESGFEFPVPIADTGTGIFLHEDRAIVFMRWIRRHLELIEQARSLPDGCEH
jgi:hypothetical protein